MVDGNAELLSTILASVTQMFCDLGLPTFDTVIHNAQVSCGQVSDSSVDTHNNKLVKHVFHICNLFSVLYVVCSYACLSVFFIFTVFLLVFMGHMLPEINLI